MPTLSHLFIILSLSVQLKPGGRIPDKGKKISVCVKNVNDLSRDVIKVCYYPSKNSLLVCAMLSKLAFVYLYLTWCWFAIVT